MTAAAAPVHRAVLDPRHRESVAAVAMTPLYAEHGTVRDDGFDLSFLHKGKRVKRLGGHEAADHAVFIGGPRDVFPVHVRDIQIR